MSSILINKPNKSNLQTYLNKSGEIFKTAYFGFGSLQSDLGLIWPVFSHFEFLNFEFCNLF